MHNRCDGGRPQPQGSLQMRTIPAGCGKRRLADGSLKVAAPQAIANIEAAIGAARVRKERSPGLFRSVLVVAMIAGVVGTAHAQDEGRKFGLIIGNDNYPVSPLKNAVRDARAIDRALQAAGFKTVVKENARKADMDRAVGEFLDKLGPDDTAL